MLNDSSSEQTINFSVDSALLAELGERLVGKSYIALAELIKNSYDADATQVIIRFDDDALVIEDNGHGMTPEEFVMFWMRVGTPHKQEEAVSRSFKRPLTGSKGIGRLAVQFLARKLRLESVSDQNTSKMLSAIVNWDDAVSSGELISATALCKVSNSTPSFPKDSPNGTRIILSELSQQWDSDDFEDLAREVWALQPPFFHGQSVAEEARQGFEIILESSDEAAQNAFENQMAAILEIWTARIRGRLTEQEMESNDRVAQVVVEFEDGTTERQEYIVKDCFLHKAAWEIRIFTLKYRQPHGIPVQKAREYFLKFGGVHVYDANFHVPYYGPDQDWLHIEQDHSHRLKESKLLPKELQVPRGMNDLPTQSRLFGIVQVNTGHEREIAEQNHTEYLGQHLSIQPSRDRLVANKAYDNLVKAVRWSLDYYAMAYRQRQIQKQESLPSKEQISAKFERIEEVIEQYKSQIPEEVYDEMRSSIAAIERDRHAESQTIAAKTNLLSTLASVGISALAFQHELNRMYREIDKIAEGFKQQLGEDSNQVISLISNLEDWIERSKATRQIFSHMLEEDNRQDRRRFKAKSLIKNVYDQLGVLRRGICLDTDHIDPELRLPVGTFVEWASIFQNVFSNAINALLDTPRTERYIAVEASCQNKECHVIIQDNGTGIELGKAEMYFQPFERGLQLSPERQSLGIGGTGLGLTIVKTIAENLSCEVEFIKPTKGFNTAFKISWSDES